MLDRSVLNFDVNGAHRTEVAVIVADELGRHEPVGTGILSENGGHLQWQQQQQRAGLSTDSSPRLRAARRLPTSA